MIKTPIKDNKKPPSFRIAHCGNFPNYHLNGISFHERNLIYLVSVGKEKFEDNWVKRFVSFIKEVKPKKINIVVADTLQRFNIEVDKNITPKQALNESIYKGQVWANKYNAYFSNLDIDCKFIHWRTLKEDIDFQCYLDEIKKLDEEDISFKEALAISSKEYTNRPSRVNSGTDCQKAEANSRQFLIEECAAFQVLAKDKDNLAIVYPGAVTKILAYAIKHINENYRAKEHTFHWLDLKPTKTNKKRKHVVSEEKEAIKPLLSRSLSLNEAQLPTYQDLSEKMTFFRRPSLHSYLSDEKPSKYIRI
ncbi:hypothetical protein [Rickettsiella endosymbiont of Xylota segnis]|uniref:hypothetical protein n=1 Tax=Rickettsiella endosymbiont of Xylota segnis TaxID=3066238 RepID=UPI0030D4A500